MFPDKYSGFLMSFKVTLFFFLNNTHHYVDIYTRCGRVEGIKLSILLKVRKRSEVKINEKEKKFKKIKRKQ